MGLRGGIRASFNTISIIEHRSLNAIARGRISNKIQHGHRPSFLCNRIYYGLNYGARTAVAGTSVTRRPFAPMPIGS